MTEDRHHLDAPPTPELGAPRPGATLGRRRAGRDRELVRQLASRALDTLFQGLGLWPCAVALAYVVGSFYGPNAGLAIYVALVFGVAAATAVSDWLTWRRHRRNSSGASYQWLSVNINADSALILRAVKARRGITTTEAVRRAIGLLSFFEGAALPPAGTEPEPPRRPNNGSVREFGTGAEHNGHLNLWVADRENSAH